MPRAWFDEKAGPLTQDWAQAFRSLERRVRDYVRRAVADVQALYDMLGEDGVIPGAIKRVAMRQQELIASKLPPGGRIDFGQGLKVVLILDQASTALTLVPPPLTARQSVHVELDIKQDSVGGRLVTGYGSAAYFPDDVDPVLTTAANARDVLGGSVDGTRGIIVFMQTVGYSA